MHVLPIVVLLAGAALVVEAATSVTLEGVTDTLSDENEKYASALMEGQSAFIEAQSIYNHDDFYQRRGWKKEHETRDGYAVYSKNSNRGRMFTISEILDARASDVMRDMWNNQVSNANRRNPLFAAATVAKLSDQCDIVRIGGAGSGREMNVVRLYRMASTSGNTDGYITAMRTVNLPDQPANNTGMPTLHLAAIRLRPDPIRSAARTLLDAVVVLDLSGVSDRAYAQQAASSMLTMMSEQAVHHFGELSSTYW